MGSAFLIRLALALTCLMPGIAQAADPVEELKACARVTDEKVRLACYDGLVQRLLRDESSVVPALPDDIGGADFEEEAQIPKKQDKGLVTSCKKGGDGRWYFYFENGQVWKEVNKRRLRFKDCNFIASVARDGFGYKMRIDGDERSIRVSRIR